MSNYKSKPQSALLIAFERVEIDAQLANAFLLQASSKELVEKFVDTDITEIFTKLEFLHDNSKLLDMLMLGVMENACALSLHGRFVEALKLLETLITHFAYSEIPQLATLRYRVVKGYLLRKGGDLKAAISILNTAIDDIHDLLDPIQKLIRLRAVLERARALKALGRNARVIRTLGDAMASWFQLIDERTEFEDNDKIINEFLDTVELFMESAFLINSYDNGIAIMEQVKKFASKRFALNYLAYLLDIDRNFQYVCGKYEKSLSLCREAIEIFNNHDDLFVSYLKVCMGKCLIKLGRSEEAILILKNTLDELESHKNVSDSHVSHCMYVNIQALRGLRRFRELMHASEKILPVLIRIGDEEKIATIFRWRAYAQLEQGNYEESLNELVKAVQAYLVIEDVSHAVSCAIEGAELLAGKVEYSKLMACFDIIFEGNYQKYTLQEDHLNDFVECLQEQLEMFQDTPITAIAICDRLIPVLQRLDRIDALGLSLKARANACWRLGQYSKALSHLEESAKTLDSLSTESLLADVEVDRIKKLDDLGRFGEVIEVASTLLNRIPNLGRKETAIVLHLSAKALWQMSRTEEALLSSKTALSAYGQVGELRGLAEATELHARILLDLKKYEEASIAFRDSIELLQISGDTIDIVLLVVQEAAARYKNNEFMEALVCYEEALLLIRSPTKNRIKAEAEFSRGEILIELGWLGEAAEAFENAGSVFKQLGKSDEVRNCALKRAECMWRDGASSEALNIISDVLKGARPTELTTSILCLLGLSFMEGVGYGNWSEALMWIEKAINILVEKSYSLDDGLAALLNFHHAEILAALARWSDAFKVLDSVEKFEIPDHLHLTYHFLVARITLMLGGVDGLRLLEDARAARRAERQKSRDEQSKRVWAVKSRRDLHRCVENYLDLGHTRKAFEAIQECKGLICSELLGESTQVIGQSEELVRAHRRSLIESIYDKTGLHDGSIVPIKSRRMHNYARAVYQVGRDRGVYQAKHIDRRRGSEVVSLEFVQEGLASHEAIIDFWWVGAEHVAVFCATKDCLTVETVRFPLSKLIDRFSSLLAHLSRRTSKDDELLDDIYALLLRGTAKKLRQHGVRRVNLIPHWLLHVLPLHLGRHSSDDGFRYFCDEFEVSYLPCAALLNRLPRRKSLFPMMSLANPEPGTSRTLPFSDWESKKLQARFPGNFKRGAEASFSQCSQWGDAGLVHFSCHGSSDRIGLLSRLSLSDDVLLAQDVLHLLPPLSNGAIVVLNGCETGMYDGNRFDEVEGFVSSFMVRGASSIVATQWGVHDACAGEFIFEYINNVANNIPSATALQLARHKVRGLTTDDLINSAENVLECIRDQQENHYEQLAILRFLADMYYYSGRIFDGDECSRIAIDICNKCNIENVIESISSAMDEAHSVSSLISNPFDDPLYWGAFQHWGV